MINPATLPLLVWLSPSFPVGAFAFSHGLEWAVEAGDIHEAESAGLWLSDLLQHGSGTSDCCTVALAWQAASAHDQERLHDLAELTCAMQPSSERRLEATMQGQAFILAALSSWSRPSLERLKPALADGVTYPVALGLVAASHEIPLAQTVSAFALSFVSNLVSALVRLGPLGQTDGQRVIAAMLPLIGTVSDEATKATLDDLGSCAFRSDIASMRHETQYTRLFRS